MKSCHQDYVSVFKEYAHFPPNHVQYLKFKVVETGNQYHRVVETKTF